MNYDKQAIRRTLESPETMQVVIQTAIREVLSAGNKDWTWDMYLEKILDDIESSLQVIAYHVHNAITPYPDRFARAVKITPIIAQPGSGTIAANHNAALQVLFVKTDVFEKLAADAYRLVIDQNPGAMDFESLLRLFIWQLNIQASEHVALELFPEDYAKYMENPTGYFELELACSFLDERIDWNPSEIQTTQVNIFSLPSHPQVTVAGKVWVKL